MLRSATAAACALALVSACGGDDSGAFSPGPQRGADLTVTVRPSGPQGRVRTRRIRCERLGPPARRPECRRLGDLTVRRLAPVPVGAACTQIYGGPAVARVTGTLGGESVDARFSREDGCQIARWDRNRDLLGRP
jgi:hypothetical protein